MAGQTSSFGQSAPVATRPFDWVAVILCGWLEVGLYLDGWAHVHVPQIETFFTPWHAVLYTGFLAVSVFTLGALARNMARGATWRRALPAGYGLSALGVALFAAGGAVDMVWHLLFGIEADVEAVLSPTHLLLAAGGTLILGGPLRSAWRTPESGTWSWAGRVPMLLSLAFVLSSLAFSTYYAHPLARPWAALGNYPGTEQFPLRSPDPLLAYGVSNRSLGHAIGVAGVLLQTGLLMGFVLALVRRWGATLPVGSLTMVFTVNAALMGFMRDQAVLIPAAALAGVGGDLLLGWLEPSPKNRGGLRIFAAVVPAIYYSLYFLTVMLAKDIWWSVHLWTGAIALAAVVGWLLSYLVVPPGTSPTAR